MKIVLRCLAAFALLVTLALIVDSSMVTAKKGRVSEQISKVGGSMYSLPFWPIGAEYVIRFDRSLNSSELADLVELNTLRGSVAVYFVCPLTPDEIELSRQRLPACDLYHDVGNGMEPL
jgi:hypothetical protein